MSPRTTFLQENSIYKISFDHRFGKPELTHRPMSEHGAPELSILPGAGDRIKNQEPGFSLNFRTGAGAMAFER